jgi:hypothetical protein
MQRYTSSNLIPLTGLLLLAIAAVLGGIVLGGIVYLISELFYIIILFPIGMGFGAGAAVLLGVYGGKVRSPIVAAGFGILAGLIVYGSYRYADYWFGFRGDLREEAEAAFEQPISDAELALLEDMLLEAEVGETGFIGYTKLYAREGFSIFNRRTGDSEGGITIKGTMAYLYWAVELAIVVGTAYLTTYGGAQRPFSEHTNEWFRDAAYLATVRSEHVYDVIDLLDQGDITALGDKLTTQAAGVPRIELVVRASSSATAPYYLAMDQLTAGRRNSVSRRTMHGWLIDPATLVTLRDTVQQTAVQPSDA